MDQLQNKWSPSLQLFQDQWENPYKTGHER